MGNVNLSGQNIQTDSAYIWTGVQTIADDVLLKLGTGGDQVQLNRSTILAANTALANVLIGTPVTQAIAADTLMIANATADGDLAFYVNDGGHSQMVFWANGDVADVALLCGAAGSVDFYVGGTKVVDISGAGLCCINDTANANMTIGLTINQAAADNEALALKSSDVAHGATAIAETDTYGVLQKVHADAGGLTLMGLRDSGGSNDGALQLSAYLAENVDTTKSTAGRGLINLYTGQLSGTTIADVVASGNLVTIVARTGAAFVTTTIFDVNGNLHTTDFVAGLGEGGVTALTGGEIRAPSLASGAGDDNVAGCNLTISPGLGRGAGTLGSVILNGSATAAADTVQTLAALLTLQGTTATLAGTLALGANNLTMTGTIAATGSRVTQSYHTNITSTNAVTVDSSVTVKHNIAPYLRDALSIVRGMDIVTFEHDEWLDPSGEVKLGIISESVMEPLALRPIQREGADSYMGLNMYGLATLNTRAIQMLDEEAKAVEERLAAVEEANRILREQLQTARVLPEA